MRCAYSVHKKNLEKIEKVWINKKFFINILGVTTEDHMYMYLSQ